MYILKTFPTTKTFPITMLGCLRGFSDSALKIAYILFFLSFGVGWCLLIQTELILLWDGIILFWGMTYQILSFGEKKIYVFTVPYNKKLVNVYQIIIILLDTKASLCLGLDRYQGNGEGYQDMMVSG